MIPKICFGLLLVGLFLLGCSRLVVGPEPIRTAEAAAAMPTAEAITLPGEDGTAARIDRRTTQLSKGEAIFPEAEQTINAGPVKDGNGHPMTGAGYRQAVYQAFPPEKRPG